MQRRFTVQRALAAKPRLLVLDEPTEGIQPSIIKAISRVIRMLAGRRDMAIVLVEQYYEFAQELAMPRAGCAGRFLPAPPPVPGSQPSGPSLSWNQFQGEPPCPSSSGSSASRSASCCCWCCSACSDPCRGRLLPTPRPAPAYRNCRARLPRPKRRRR